MEQRRRKLNQNYAPEGSSPDRISTPDRNAGGPCAV
jgi:hypothetical protein